MKPGSFIVLACFWPLAAIASEIGCLKVSASAVRIEGRPKLHLEFANACGMDVRPLDGLLPWKMLGVRLAATTAGSEAALERLGGVRGGNGPTIEIKSDQVLSGDLSMSSEFDGFDDANSKDDIVVVWSYEMPESMGGDTRSGTVVFPKSP